MIVVYIFSLIFYLGAKRIVNASLVRTKFFKEIFPRAVCWRSPLSFYIYHHDLTQSLPSGCFPLQTIKVRAWSTVLVLYSSYSPTRFPSMTAGGETKHKIPQFWQTIDSTAPLFKMRSSVTSVSGAFFLTFSLHIFDRFAVVATLQWFLFV